MASFLSRPMSTTSVLTFCTSPLSPSSHRRPSSQLHDELIPGYTCDRCKCARNSTRSARLVSHPPVLLLTIKRTRYNPKTRRAYKDYRPVAFPTRLPLSCLPLAEGEGEGEGGETADGEMHYRLSSVIVHSSAPDRRTGRASAELGHYYTYCCESRGDGGDATGSGDGDGGRSCWLEKNDARVRVASEGEVLRNEKGCFVLAYELIGPHRLSRASSSGSVNAPSTTRPPPTRQPSRQPSRPASVAPSRSTSAAAAAAPSASTKSASSSQPARQSTTRARVTRPREEEAKEDGSEGVGGDAGRMRTRARSICED